MNNCGFTGRFASAPRRNNTSNGTSRCYFTLMVNKEGKKPDGTRYPAQAVDFVAWGKLADLICQYKSKGDLVLVYAEYSTYEREALDMNNQPIPNARKVQRGIFSVKSIEFLGNASGNQNGNNNQQSAANNDALSEIPSYNAEDFPIDNNSDANTGDIPFDFGNSEEDPFNFGGL